MADKPHSIILDMHRGPFQNNGAAPWYTEVTIGTPPQSLKVALDTGTNMAWITSDLCAPDHCEHTSGRRYFHANSSTFEFINQKPRDVNFGAWGTMKVETGNDVLTLKTGDSLRADFCLASDYSGTQFKELDWDGGLGIPSGSDFTLPDSSFVVNELLNNGSISATAPFVAFDWNPAVDGSPAIGTCEIGGYDPKKMILEEALWLPWTPYTAYPDVEFLWGTHLDTMSIGGVQVATNKLFTIDSGSSQFKGDTKVMADSLAQIARQGGNPDVTLTMGGGQITVTSDMYNVLLEAGEGAGTVEPQFKDLGMKELVLVGSVVMDYCYSIHEYKVTSLGHGKYSLSPVGTLIANKPGGPKLITKPNLGDWKPGSRVDPGA